MRFMIKKHALNVVMILMFSNILCFAYLVKIAERTPDLPGEKFDVYSNCLWYAFITMSTVGYGDIYAETTYGRLISIIIGITGIFINSLITVILNDIFTFIGGELKSFNKIKMLELRNEVRVTVKDLVKHMGTIIVLKKKLLRSDDKSSLQERMRIMNLINKVDDLRLISLRKYRGILESYNNLTETDKIVEFNEKISKIKKSLESLETIH